VNEAVQTLPTEALLQALFVFVLAAFVGYEVVSKVPTMLHTPLMSGANAVHGVIVVGAIDASSILLSRSRAADLAKDASISAAEALRQGGDEEQAKLAALDTIADADEPVRLKRIDVGRREVTVVLVVRADTLVVERIPFLDDLDRVSVSGSSSVPRD